MPFQPSEKPRRLHPYSRFIFALAATAALTACNDTAKDTHPDQPVTKRNVIFKQFTRTLEPMGLVARDRQDYNKREFLANALELEKLSTQPWAYFTPDSNYPPTHAKAEVWAKSAEFKEAQDKYKALVSQLVKTAQGADLALIRSVVNDVQKSCKSCHNQFRNDS
jgi:cytochrome c556